MNHESQPVRRAGSTPDITTNPQQMFASCYNELLALASDDPRLKLPVDPGMILDGIAKRLHLYDSLDNDFRLWGTQLVLRERSYIALMRDCEPSIRGGIWRVLRSCSDLMDDSTVEILTAEMWVWAWLNLDALMTPGSAKLSTRLNQRAYWVARSWRTTRLRERDRHADLSELEPELDTAEDF
jgi:hypothetical protein